MITINFSDSVKISSGNKTGKRFPNRVDIRYQDGLLFPELKPSFNIESGATIFTIGSCFARNIEGALMPLGFNLPTTAFAVPSSEWAVSPNGLLNEYNPGTIAQRILYALDNKFFPDETIVPSDSLYADLMILGTAPDVTQERALERRKEIFAVYQNLQRSSFVIITLGFIEAWFDNQTQLFINRMPPKPYIKNDRSRFSIKILDVLESLQILEPAIDALANQGIKVILTVSPVPIQTTFTSSDCVTANEYSKAVLRVCSEQLTKRFDNVDYFPSYEIVRSGGLACYKEDNVHVMGNIVNKITALMIREYSRSG